MQKFTFQKLWTNINKVNFLSKISLIEFPDTWNEGVLFHCAACNPFIHFVKMQVKFRILLQKMRYVTGSTAKWFSEQQIVYAFNYWWQDKNEITQMPTLSRYTNSGTLMHLNEGAKTLKVKNQNPHYEDSILSSQIRQQ